MVRVAKRGSAAFLAASLFFSMAPALADEPSPTEQARLGALLRKAETAAKARQWEACVQAYTEAMAIEDAPRTAGELGLCEEQLHRFADAHQHLDRAMDAAPTDPTAAPWKHYQAAMVRLRERVAILFITVSPPDAAVVLDGRPIGRADGRHVALEPGPHTITARLRGYEDATRTLTVIAPSVPHVDLELKRLPQPAPSPSAASERRPAAPSSPALATTSPAPPPWYMPGASPRGVLVPLAAVGVATALVSGATSIALEVDRASVRSSLNTDTCSAAATSRPAICDTLAERYDQRNIAFGVAIGATITSGLLAGAAGIASRFEGDATRPQVAPAVGANGGGIVVVGSW